MKCPFCGQDNTRVVDSRPVEESNTIRRRRMCDSCGRRFTTYEKLETISLIIIFPALPAPTIMTFLCSRRNLINRFAIRAKR